jgi:PAS domain S-box-containing protein
MPTLSTGPSSTPRSSAPFPGQTDALGVLLELALEATAATGAALLAPDGEELRVLQTRGANAPGAAERLKLEGTVAGEAFYRGRLVTGAEAPPRGRQGGLRQDDRTVDVMAVPIMIAGQSASTLVLYHRHLGHFRRNDATTLTRLAAVAARLWVPGSGLAAAPPPRAGLEVRAAARMALVAAGQFQESEAWDEVARTAASLLECPSARVSLLEEDELVCHAAIGRFAGDLGRRRLRDYGFEGVALETREGFLASEWTPETGAAGSSWMRSVIAVPLRRVEQVMGVLTVAAETGGRFEEPEREALLRFAVQAAAALIEVRLAAESERHFIEGRLATQVAAGLAAVEDTPALRRAIVSELRLALQADGARLSEEVQRRMAVTAVDGDVPALVRPPVPGPELLCGHALGADEVSHRCALPGGEGFLIAAKLGQVTSHPGSLQLVRRGRPFAAHEEALLRRLSEIAELALISRLTNVRISHYADRIRSVAEVSASLHQSLRPADAMSQAAEMLRRALNIGTVRIARVDEVWQELTFPVYRRGAEAWDGARRPIGRGVIEDVWRTGRTCFFPANAMEEAARTGATFDTSPRCFAAAPLRIRGAVVGVVAIEDEAHDHAFEAEDVRILEIVSQQLGVTLENLESLEEERRQRITAEWLRLMARTVTEPGVNPLYVLELATEAAFQGIGGQAALAELLPGNARRTLVASRGRLPQAAPDPLPTAGSVEGWMLEEQGAVFISANAAEDPRLSPAVQEQVGALALAAVPIWCDNRIIATLKLARPVGTSFAMADVERLAQIADHAGAGFQTATAGEALRRSEERYRRLFSVATDAIVTLDRQGVLTSLNEAAERVWHVRARQVVGTRWDLCLPFDAPETVVEEVARALGGESRAFETTVRRPDGERGVVAVTISPLVEQGQVTTVLGIARDVTDARRFQAQLLQAEKMSAIGQLVGGMAHEINNPLASIAVNMELMLADAREPAQVETLRAIKVEAERAAQIVRRLLTYVRGQGSQRVEIDLREAVRGAVALRRNQLLNRHVEVVVDLPDEPVVVWGNTINLQQVLMNLLVNAEQAIEAHRGHGTVWVRLSRQDGTAAITVEDDGPGIPPEVMTRVFDPFYTTKPEGEGTGLGLSVSAGIVADHEGKISAAPRPEGGARFTVTVPLRAGSRVEEGRPEPRGLAAPVALAGRGRVLIIDDEPDIRRSISRFLTRSGWQVSLAESGEEGLQRLTDVAFDVLLCDLRMPGMSGTELYRRLQASGSPAIERLIFMTGDVLSPEASRFLQEAGRPVLSKPFALQDLAETLAQVVSA